MHSMSFSNFSLLISCKFEHSVIGLGFPSAKILVDSKTSIPPPKTNVFHLFPNHHPFLIGVSIHSYEAIARPKIRVTWIGFDHQ